MYAPSHPQQLLLDLVQVTSGNTGSTSSSLLLN